MIMMFEVTVVLCYLVVRLLFSSLRLLECVCNVYDIYFGHKILSLLLVFQYLFENCCGMEYSSFR
jgi:hypothetical protein